MAILASLFWGFGFVGSRWAVEVLSPAWVTGLRFFLSAVMMSPIVIFKFKKQCSKNEIVGAAIASILLTAVMILQTMSLKYTTVSKCGFITILYVLVTPLITRFFFKEKLGIGFIGSLIVSLIGVGFLFELNISNFNYGDLLAFISAMIFSAHLLLIDHLIKDSKIDLVRFNFLQILFAGVIAIFYASFKDGFLDYAQVVYIAQNKYLVFIGIISTALFSTTLGFLFQIKSQLKIKPHIIGLIFLSECGFAALFGNIFLGEKLSMISITGCIILFAAVSYSPLKEIFNFKISRILKPISMVFLFIILSSFN